MNGDDAFGPRRYRGLKLVAVDAPGGRVDIDEDRFGADIRDDIGDGHVGKRGNDDLLIGASIQGKQCEVERRCAVAYRHTPRPDQEVIVPALAYVAVAN